PRASLLGAAVSAAASGHAAGGGGDAQVLVGLALLVLPPLLVPDLGASEHAVGHDLVLEVGVLAEHGRDHDAALLVGGDLNGVTAEATEGTEGPGDLLGVIRLLGLVEGVFEAVSDP